jgi:hypothetical protein
MTDEQFGYLLTALTGFGCLFTGLIAAVKKLPETSLLFTIAGLITVIGTTVTWVFQD